MAGVGKDLKDHPVPAPCHGQGCPPPAQAAQGPIQPGFECLQGWGTTASLGSCASSSPPFLKNFFLKTLIRRVLFAFPLNLPFFPVTTALSLHLLPLQLDGLQVHLRRTHTLSLVMTRQEMLQYTEAENKAEHVAAS